MYGSTTQRLRYSKYMPTLHHRRHYHMYDNTTQRLRYSHCMLMWQHIMT